jgi:hypothetical protein
MILRPEPEGTVLAIGQASHAWLSGQLARAWGNESFPAPEPFEELCLAADQHDVGMARWDLDPDPHPETGLPMQFFELPRTTHIQLWTGAPSSLVTQSRYAALLVSLHGTGLYERFPPRNPTPREASAVAAYRAGQRAFQARLAVELGLDAPALEFGQALLAAWDAVSLAMCRDDLPNETSAPGREGAVALTVAGQGTNCTLDPWPLGVDKLTVHCEGVRIPGRGKPGGRPRDLLANGPLVRLAFTLRPA